MEFTEIHVSLQIADLFRYFSVTCLPIFPSFGRTTWRLLAHCTCCLLPKSVARVKSSHKIFQFFLNYLFKFSASTSFLLILRSLHDWTRVGIFVCLVLFNRKFKNVKESIKYCNYGRKKSYFLLFIKRNKHICSLRKKKNPNFHYKVVGLSDQ